MALTTASTKLRSTILFETKDEQVLFKRSSADLASIRGLTPSTLLAKLPVEQLARTESGRQAARHIYSEGGDCLDAFEAVFEEWSAIPPRKECLDVVKGFFDYCRTARVCIDTAHERVHHLKSNWDSVCLIVANAAKANAGDVNAQIQVKTGRELERLLGEQTTLLAVSPMLSYLIEVWDLVKNVSCTYRVLLDFAHAGKSSRNDFVEPPEARVKLLRIIDDFEEKGVPD